MTADFLESGDQGMSEPSPGLGPPVPAEDAESPRKGAPADPSGPPLRAGSGQTRHASAPYQATPRDLDVVMETGDACQPWSVGSVPPMAVAFPRSAEEAAQVMVAARNSGLSVAPAGAGTWLATRGARPVDLVVSVQRMRRVSEYEPADLTITAEAGLTLATLARTTVPERQFLALDPPGAGTLGGLVSTASSGPLRALYGTPRDHVLGATVVTGDGRVLQLGGRVVKNVAGFDLIKLIVGGWGAFGLITSVTVRLYPIPKVDRTLVFRGERESVLDLARKISAAPLVPAALELVDEVDADGKGNTLIAIRLLGSEAATGSAAEVFEKAAGRPADDRFSGTDSSAMASVVRRAGAMGQITTRVAASPRQAPEFLREVAARLPSYSGAAHLSDGAVRIGWDAGDARQELEALQDLVDSFHGRMTVLTGPMAWNSGVRGRSPGLQRILDGLKSEFDPGTILWPGRFGGGR